ncbi:MAG: hypothetical protein C4558_06355 [Dehalococcoidia bacterium]|nr:MAG: hypothetical protein C4558_06355 [Dehalococcoidia bacterium]
MTRDPKRYPARGDVLEAMTTMGRIVRRTVDAVTAEIAGVIRQRRLAGEPLKRIAQDYGISDSLVSLIALGRLWRQKGGAQCPTSA